MKILFITSRADIGGGSKHLWDLISHIENVDNYIAAPQEEPFYKLYSKKSVATFKLPHRKFSLLAFLKLIIWSKKHSIKIVHSHGRGAGIYSRLMKPFGFKVIHTAHGVHTENNLIGKVKIFIDQILAHFTDFFIFVSEDEFIKAQKYKVILKDQNYKVILNGVSERVKKNHSRNNVFSIGIVARADFAKGLDIMLSYFYKFLEEFPSTEVLIKIAGTSEKEINLTNINPQIKFLGSIFPIEDFFDEIDALISFSRFEGLPLSVLEAMISEVPCLLSNVVGHKYFIDHNLADTFELENYESFKENFIKLKNNPPSIKKLKEIHEFISKHHSQDKMSKEVLEIYKGINKHSY